MWHFDCMEIISEREDSEKFERFLESVGEDPKVIHEITGDFYCFEKSGIDVLVGSRTSRVLCVNLYSGEDGRYSQFKGLFAAKVSFADTKQNVLEKMGEPWKSTIIVKPPSPLEFSQASQQAEHQGVDVKTLLDQLQSVSYRIGEDRYWNFKFNMDDSLFAAGAYCSYKSGE